MRSACGALVTRGGDGNSPKPPRQRTFSPSLSSCFCSAFLLLLLLDSGRLQASTTERVVSCPEKRAPMRRHTPQKARRQTSYGIRSIGRCTITCQCGVVPCRIAVDDGTLLLAAVPAPFTHHPSYLSEAGMLLMVRRLLTPRPERLSPLYLFVCVPLVGLGNGLV